MAELSWKAIAEALAQRMFLHAYCDEHPHATPNPGCPFCKDRAAYDLYITKTGRDGNGNSISDPDAAE